MTSDLPLNHIIETLDDAWNAGPESPEWETFRKRHTDNVAVCWPDQPEPTRWVHNHDVTWKNGQIVEERLNYDLMGC